MCKGRCQTSYISSGCFLLCKSRLKSQRHGRTGEARGASHLPDKAKDILKIIIHYSQLPGQY